MGAPLNQSLPNHWVEKDAVDHASHLKRYTDPKIVTRGARPHEGESVSLHDTRDACERCVRGCFCAGTSKLGTGRFPDSAISSSCPGHPLRQIWDTRT